MIELPIFDIVFLTIVGLLELIFAIYILTRYEKSGAIITFGLFSLCVSGWVLINGLGLLLERGSLVSDLVFRFAFVVVLFLFAFLYLFVLLFPYPTMKIDGRLVTFLLLPPVLFSVWIYSSKSLIEGFDSSKYANTIYGSDYWIYGLYLLFMYFFALSEIINRFQRLDGIHLWQMRVIFYAILFSGVIGFTNHLILPYFFRIYTTAWVGPGSSIIWLGLMGWILVKK